MGFCTGRACVKVRMYRDPSFWCQCCSHHAFPTAALAAFILNWILAFAGMQPLPLSLPDQVFDIMPLYGMLEPSEIERMTFTFYGHADIVARVKAICEVEGGPTYEILLRGEASLVSYAFDRKEIDYGLQVSESCTHLTLQASGRSLQLFSQ